METQHDESLGLSVPCWLSIAVRLLLVARTKVGLAMGSDSNTKYWTIHSMSAFPASSRPKPAREQPVHCPAHLGCLADREKLSQTQSAVPLHATTAASIQQSKCLCSMSHPRSKVQVRNHTMWPLDSLEKLKSCVDLPSLGKPITYKYWKHRPFLLFISEVFVRHKALSIISPGAFLFSYLGILRSGLTVVLLCMLLIGCSFVRLLIGQFICWQGLKQLALWHPALITYLYWTTNFHTNIKRIFISLTLFKYRMNNSYPSKFFFVVYFSPSFSACAKVSHMISECLDGCGPVEHLKGKGIERNPVAIFVIGSITLRSCPCLSEYWSSRARGHWYKGSAPQRALWGILAVHYVPYVKSPRA